MQNLKKKSGILVSAAIGVLITACSGNGVGSVSTSAPLQAKEAVGATEGATCVATGWGGSPTYGTGTTDGSGLENLNLVFSKGIPEDVAILVTCTGGTYWDEATGTEIAFPAGETLTAAISSSTVAGGSAEVAVTPFTTIAVDQLIDAGVTPTGDAVNNVNAQVAKVFGLASITAEPATVNSTTPIFGTDAASAYALALAALADAAAAAGESQFAYVAALSAALASGDASAVSEFQSELASAVTTYVASLAALGDVVPATLVSSVITGILTGITTITINPTTGS